MPHPIHYLLMQPEHNRILNETVADIRRCQEWYLFDNKGNKILDLYAANTRSMLGHKPLSMSNRIKQRINQGLWPSVPVCIFRDFIARCKQLFSGYRYYCFAPSLRYVFEMLARDSRYSSALWIDPAVPPNGLKWIVNNNHSTGINEAVSSADQKHPTTTQRHNTNTEVSSNNHHTRDAASKSADGVTRHPPTVGIGRIFCSIPDTDILLPIIPHPDEGVPQLIATSDDAVYTMFRNSIIPSGIILTALLEMVKYFEHRHHHNALRHTNRADYISPPLSMSDLPPSIWVLHKHYLWSTLPTAQYRNMYHAMLAHNILIHPNPHAPSILPFRLPKSDYLRFIEITASINNTLI